jgi:hypothetical protein
MSAAQRRLKQTLLGSEMDIDNRAPVPAWDMGNAIGPIGIA